MRDTHLPIDSHALPSGDRLLESLRHWRDADAATAAAPFAWNLRAIDANRAVVERAKGVLVLRYGIDSYQAFAVLVRWSHLSRIPVHTIAHALVHGICQGSPRTGDQQRPLIRWLEDQLRHNDPDSAGVPAPGIQSRDRP